MYRVRTRPEQTIIFVTSHKKKNAAVQIEGLIDQALQRHRAGRLQEAEKIYRQILHSDPSQPDALHLLGFIAYQVGRYTEAVELIDKAIERAPQAPDLYNHLGLALAAQGRRNDAIHAYQKAIELNPRFPEALNNLGSSLRAVGELSAALTNYRLALDCQPDFADTWNNLGNLYRDMGEFDQALQAFRQALAFQLDFSAAHSNMLFLLSHHLITDPVDVLEEHRKWDRHYGMEGRRHAFMHSRQGDPGKRLRVAYVSPDFRQHAVNYFFEPLLKAHDRNKFEIVCYAEVTMPDEATRRLKAEADGWRFTTGMTDAALAKQIQQDGIDILVDLAGHTTRNRLKVFTWRPAPIQVTYIGYCATTGLEAMDYWLTDSIIHPRDTIEQAVETIVRLPHCWVCYQPPEDAPPIKMPQHDGIVFGCFNDRSKITPQTIALWSRILAQVPGSRMLLKARQYADKAARERIAAMFAEREIAAGRLTFEPAATMPEYLAAYNQIDIALDPLPRTGGVTTAETLWMGVPLITLRGQRFIERHSASLLVAAGTSDWIADNPEEYIAKAVALANDHEGRRHLRMTQREKVAASSLCDARLHAQAVEQAYRQMWTTYLNTTNDD